MGSKGHFKEKTVYDYLSSARMKANQANAVSEMAGVSASAVQAQAFLIHLANLTIPPGDSLDIVLASWGLLEGYQDAGVGTRRKKYIINTGYRGSKKEYQPDIIPTEAEQSHLSESLAKKESALFKVIENSIFNFNLGSLFVEACKKYIDKVTGQVGELPKPYRMAMNQSVIIAKEQKSTSKPNSIKIEQLAVIEPPETDGYLELLFVDGNDAGIHFGDSDNGRKIYTKREANSGALGERIVFNSLSDGKFGDERNYVGVSLADNNNPVWYGREIKVEDGKIYLISLYVHNDNPGGLNTIAEGVRVNFSVPTTIGNSHTIIGYLNASNSQPGRYWDAVTLRADQDIYVVYLDGSAWYYNKGIGKIRLPNDVITSGVSLGYDRFDGKIPGGDSFDGIVTIKVKVCRSVSSKLKIKARLKGAKYWTEAVYANIGDEVEYQIEYQNLLNERIDNVMIRDILPSNIIYIAGSTYLYNSSFPKGGRVIEDTVTTTGINVGSYNRKGNAFVRFSGKVVDNCLSDGNNQLVNWASATVNGKVYKDDVSVLVAK